MIGVCAALVLSLSTAGADAGSRRGTSTSTSARAARDENALRAKRGLLPRKSKATPPRRARAVLPPSAPAFLGEPRGVTPAPAARAPAGALRPLAVASGVEVEVSVTVRWTR
jgi:hypothetical protein